MPAQNNADGTITLRPRATSSGRLTARASLPTRHGNFHVSVYVDERGKEHVALVRGEVRGKTHVPVRIHSECLTGDVLGSLRCDCRDQLERALEEFGRLPEAVLLYLRQEGRGIGLANKIRAYQLQEHGLDTIDANLALGFEADERDYGVAATMLEGLGVRSVRLYTNNPDKVEQLVRHGVDVQRVPHAMTPGVHNRAYLETKARQSGHMIETATVSGGRAR